MVKNRTYVKAVVRAVGSSLSRFLAIFAIVGLGVGFLAGLSATTPDMRYSMGLYLNETRFMDLRIVGNLGLCEEDVRAIRSTDGIKNAAGARSIDLQVVTDSGDTLVARMHGVRDGLWGGNDPSFINGITLSSGRWPERPNEVVVQKEYRTDEDLSVGKKLTLLSASSDLSLSDFDIVGTVTTGYYISPAQRGSTSVGNGRIGCVVFLCDSVFNMDYYTDIFAVVDGAAEQTAFSEEYDETVAAVQMNVKKLSIKQKYVRRDAIVADANAQLSKAQSEFDEKSAEGRKKLDDALALLEDGRHKYEKGKRELRSGEAEYRRGVADLEEAKEDFARLYAEKSAELADGKARLILGWAEYEEGLEELSENRAKLEEGERLYEEGRRELEQAKKELDEAKARLDYARLQLDDGWNEYNSGRVRLEDARKQIDEGQKQLDDGRAQLQATIDQVWAEKEKADAIVDSDDLSPETLRAELETFLSEDTTLPDSAKTRIRDYLAELDEQLAQHPEETEKLDEMIEEGRAAYQKYSDEATQRLIDELTKDGRSQLEDAERQLADARAQYADGAAQLSAGRRALQEGEMSYDAGYAEWNEGRLKYEEALAKLNESRAELDEGQKQLQEGEQKLIDARLELEENQKKLDDGLAALEAGRQEAELSFADAAQKLIDAKQKLEEGLAELLSSEKKLSQGQADYDEGLKTYEDEIEKAQDRLTDARDKIRDMEAPAWYVLTRDANPGYVSYASDTMKVESIAKVFPLFFFAVAALVASTTMTRMVEEERGHIGTLKALGYGNGKIAAKYLIYAGTAGLAGSAFGLVVGLRLFPAVIYNAYKLMYYLPKLHASNHAYYAVLSTALILAAILVATYGALRGSLRGCAAELMRPKAPPPGKRILLERVKPLWKRMKFTHKVTARNLFRYKKRFLMTVIGIAGCTALLLTGFGLRNSISDIVGIQFGELLDYNLTVALKHEGDETQDRRLRAVFDDKNRVTDFTAVHMESCVGALNGAEVDLNVVVPKNEKELSQFIVFRERLGHKPVPFTEKGALLSEKAAATLHVKAGDVITLRRTDDSEMQVPVGGIIENYVYGYMYLPGDLYEKGFGDRCEYTTLLCRANDPDEKTRDEISTALLSSPNTLSVQFSTTIMTTFADMLKSIDYIVIVIIISAGALAFVVLYNLTNINITERQKELATIKVLGFYAPEVSAYVYRETLILSLIGIAAGLFGGIFLHSFVVQTAEVDAVMFGRTIRPLSYVYSAALTAFFSLLVSLVMNVKLRKIDMVESLKAPE